MQQIAYKGERRIREYLAGKGESIEGLSFRELLKIVTGNDTYLKETGRFFDLGGQEDPDPRRTENIRAAMQSLEPGRLVRPGVPSGPGFEVFGRRGKTVNDAARATREWASGLGPAMLTLAGPPGVGKTHLAVAAANYLVAEKALIAYRTEAILIVELREGLDDKNVDPVLARFIDIPWLIIDDLGTEALPDWLTTKEDRLFNERYEAAAGGRTRTMVTTNLLGKDLPGRIASRLGDVERGRVMQISASDYRKARRS